MKIFAKLWNLVEIGNNWSLINNWEKYVTAAWSEEVTHLVLMVAIGLVIVSLWVAALAIMLITMVVVVMAGTNEVKPSDYQSFHSPIPWKITDSRVWT